MRKLPWLAPSSLRYITASHTGKCPSLLCLGNYPLMVHLSNRRIFDVAHRCKYNSHSTRISHVVPVCRHHSQLPRYWMNQRRSFQASMVSFPVMSVWCRQLLRAVLYWSPPGRSLHHASGISGSSPCGRLRALKN